MVEPQKLTPSRKCYSTSYDSPELQLGLDIIDDPKQKFLISPLTRDSSIADEDDEDQEDFDDQIQAVRTNQEFGPYLNQIREISMSPSFSINSIGEHISKPMISMHKPLTGSAPTRTQPQNKGQFQCFNTMYPLAGIINLFQLLRIKISKNRKRIQRGDFDLDMSYITRRIVAMSMPGINPVLALVRNPYSQVKSYLDTYHYKRYKVYNLCVECPYDGNQLFENRYSYFPIEDYQPGNLSLLYAFCSDASEWLDTHPENIIVVHCKAGKGRTGCLISSFLCYLGITEQGEYEDFSDPEKALSRFAQQRTTNNEGVTRASQKNYVREFGKIVNELKFGMFEISHPIRMEKVVIQGLREECRKSKILVKIYFRKTDHVVSQKVVHQEFSYRHNPSYDEQLSQQSSGYMYYMAQDENHLVLDFRTLLQNKTDENWEIDGDVKITVKRVGALSKTLFYVWFSTMALPNQNSKIVGVEDLDKPYKYIRSSPQQIKVEFSYKKLDNNPTKGYNPQQDHFHGILPSYSTIQGESTFEDLENQEDLFASPFIDNIPSLKNVASVLCEDSKVNTLLEGDEGIFDAGKIMHDNNQKKKQNISMLSDFSSSRSLQRLLTPSSHLPTIFSDSLRIENNEEVGFKEEQVKPVKNNLKKVSSMHVVNQRNNNNVNKRRLSEVKFTIGNRSHSEENLGALVQRYIDDSNKNMPLQFQTRLGSLINVQSSFKTQSIEDNSINQVHNLNTTDLL